MAEAYECDRCGSLNGGTPHTLITIGDGEPRHGRQDREREDRGIGAQIAGDDHYDVCPGCRSAFEVWWNDE